MSTKNMRLIIILEQKFYVAEWREHGHSNSKIRQAVEMPESVVWNIIKLQEMMQFP
jgi:hypothetical protein